MPHLVHHSANTCVVGTFHNPVQFAKAQAFEHGFLLFVEADPAAHLLDLDRHCLVLRLRFRFCRFCHGVYSSATALPRASATSAALRNWRSACMVALTTL